MNKTNEMMDKLGKQFSQLQEKMDAQKENSEKAAKDVMATVQGEINRLSEETRLHSEKTKSQVSTELLKAQMTFNAKKDDIKKSLESKKFETEKQRAEYEVEVTAEYAAFAMNIALIAIDEATLAFYMATEKLADYETKYGEENEE